MVLHLNNDTIKCVVEEEGELLKKQLGNGERKGTHTVNNPKKATDYSFKCESYMLCE